MSRIEDCLRLGAVDRLFMMDEFNEALLATLSRLVREKIIKENQPWTEDDVRRRVMNCLTVLGSILGRFAFIFGEMPLDDKDRALNFMISVLTGSDDTPTSEEKSGA